jgi:beta-xylosidase
MQQLLTPPPAGQTPVRRCRGRPSRYDEGPQRVGGTHARREEGQVRVLDSVMFWNEPNNKSHWNFDDFDPEWTVFSEMTRLAGEAVRAVNPALPRVLGGISPIDPVFLQRMERLGVLTEVDAVAVHGFPLDWNNWKLDEWPARLDEVRAVVDLPVWVSEVGVSTFGADEVQDFGLRRTAELLAGQAPRVHWYSLYDLPAAWPATTRHREAEGSSYYRHFHMGLVREDGSDKPALRTFTELTPELGICQWFHFEDPRLDDAVVRLRRLGVRHVRTGLSWADFFRPDALAWFDRMMSALEPFEVTATFCFTPEHLGLEPHHTSPPREVGAFAEFAAEMVRRYAPGNSLHGELACARSGY